MFLRGETGVREVFCHRHYCRWMRIIDTVTNRLNNPLQGHRMDSTTGWEGKGERWCDCCYSIGFVGLWICVIRNNLVEVMGVLTEMKDTLPFWHICAHLYSHLHLLCAMLSMRKFFTSFLLTKERYTSFSLHIYMLINVLDPNNSFQSEYPQTQTPQQCIIWNSADETKTIKRWVWRERDPKHRGEQGGDDNGSLGLIPLFFPILEPRTYSLSRP